jgi:hypothetical protein
MDDFDYLRREAQRRLDEAATTSDLEMPRKLTKLAIQVELVAFKLERETTVLAATGW